MPARFTALLLVLALLILWAGAPATRCLERQLQKAEAAVELTTPSAAPAGVCRISAVEPQIASATLAHPSSHAATATPIQMQLARAATAPIAPARIAATGLHGLDATHTILRI